MTKRFPYYSILRWCPRGGGIRTKPKPARTSQFMGVHGTHPECHIARKIPPNSALLDDPKKRVSLRKHAPGNRKIYQDEMVGGWRSGQPWPLNLSWVTWGGGVPPRCAFSRPHKFRTGCPPTTIHQTLVGCQSYSYSCNLVVDIKCRISEFPKATIFKAIKPKSEHTLCRGWGLLS